MNQTGIIYMDDPSQVTAALFHAPSQGMRDYISSSVQNYVQAVQSVAPDFAASIQNRYNAIKSSAAVQYVKNIKNRINSLWQSDTIRYLDSIEKIQQAPDSMKRWVMAQQDLRQLHQHNGCSAYDRTYVDLHPIGTYKAHYDYRRITEGVVVKQPDEETVGYSVFYESVLEEDILSVIQKACILGTHDVIEHSIKSGDRRDPVSPWNGTL